MKRWELIAAFERHGIDKSEYSSFAKLVRHGLIDAQLEARLWTHRNGRLFRNRRYFNCLTEIITILNRSTYEPA